MTGTAVTPKHSYAITYTFGNGGIYKVKEIRDDKGNRFVYGTKKFDNAFRGLKNHGLAQSVGHSVASYEASLAKSSTQNSKYMVLEQQQQAINGSYYSPQNPFTSSVLKK